MSKNNGSKKDDMNDFDPYSFFKLEGPEDNKNNKKRNKRPKRNFSFLGFLLLLLIGLTIVQLNLPGKFSVSEIEFSKFREMVLDGQIVEVEIGENYYLGYGPQVVVPVENNKEEKGFRVFAKEVAARENRPVYKASGYPLSKFIELLDEKKVTYKFVTKQNNAILSMLISLAGPIIFFAIIWFILFK